MLSDRPRREADSGTWVRLCRSAEVVSRRGIHFELDFEHDVALFRVDEAIVAVSNVCPHKREALIYDGHVQQGTVTCPVHFWCFDLRTGKNVGSGADLKTYLVEERDGYVWVLIRDLDA